MKEHEGKSVTKVISFIKSEWRISADDQRTAGSERERSGWGFAGGRSSGLRDSLCAMIQFYRLDIPCDMNPLPDDFNIEDHLKEVK